MTFVPRNVILFLSHFRDFFFLIETKKTSKEYLAAFEA